LGPLILGVTYAAVSAFKKEKSAEIAEKIEK
jgi:predicted transcriptional regulator